MFGRNKNKENNISDSNVVVDYTSDSVEQVNNGKEKILNSLAVFTNVEPPVYKKEEKSPRKIHYTANKDTDFYQIKTKHLKNIGFYKDIHCYIIDTDSDILNNQITPLVEKITINLEKEYYTHKLDLIIEDKNFIIFGIPLESCKKYDEINGERFKMTIFTFIGEGEHKYVKAVFDFDIFSTEVNIPQYTFYKNPYFLRSLFNFLRSRIDSSLVNEIFEKTKLFNNEIEL